MEGGREGKRWLAGRPSELKGMFRPRRPPESALTLFAYCLLRVVWSPLHFFPLGGSGLLPRAIDWLKGRG